MQAHDIDLFAAPLQGYTEAPFRRFHHAVYGGDVTYTTPFVRCEHGEPRARDMRDALSPTDARDTAVQIIFADVEEFKTLTSALQSNGRHRIDLNLGCPFPPQVRKGRGAGMLTHSEILGETAAIMANMPQLRFSAKMRLGIDSPEQWHEAIAAINAMPLTHITVHPRIAAQQYKGELHISQFEQLLAESRHPVVFNGDIATVGDIDDICTRYGSRIAGVMVGRGLLARPSLLAEWQERREWSRDRRIEHLLELHRLIFEHYSKRLCGTSQLLAKIKPFWEYSEAEIGHKALKAIKKSHTAEAYRQAVESIT